MGLNGQLDLFEAAPRVVRQWTRAEHWDSLGYDGPASGRLCDIDTLCVDLESGGSIYAYMEQCRLIEHRPDGKWLAVIEMGTTHGTPWGKDGTRVLLSEDDIWPPMRQPIERRNDLH